MIDLHAHMLPGLDDGPPDVDAALALARASRAAGTTAAATSSHVDHGYQLEPARFAGWRADMQARIDAAGVDLRLLQGGEVALTRLPDLSDDELRLVTLGGGNTILLEPPFVPTGVLLENGVFQLQSRGFDVLLAHPERSPDFATRLDELTELTDRGVRFQITASSLSGAFGTNARDLATELLRRGAVHVIASDAHGATSRSPDMGKHLDAVAKQLPEVAEAREYFTLDAPRAIVEGTKLAPPPVVRPARGLGRLGRRHKKS